MSDLNRHLAPLSADAWEAIEDEARDELTLSMAGRRIADVTGPLGWQAASVTSGRVGTLSSSPVRGVTGALRQVQPLLELRAAFELSREELRAMARGAPDADLDPVRHAARALARAEDRAIFHGYPEAGIVGFRSATAHGPLAIAADYERYPALVASALTTLRTAGVGGPYAIALGPRCYTGLSRTTTRGGFPVLQHVERLLSGPVIWAPHIQGAVVVSLRGGDFELTLGRDVSIGYLGHDAESVQLYLEESMTFRVLAGEAAVPLVYEDEQQHMSEKLDEALDETFPASDPVELSRD